MKTYYIFNSKSVAEKEISLSKLKRGFLYSDGLFETLRAENYRLFRWADHWERMQKGMGVCNLKIAEKGAVLKGMIEDTLKEHRLADAYIRVSVFRKETDSFDPGDESRSNVLIQMKKYHPYPERFYKNGMRCFISKKYFRNKASPLVYIKSLNYLENLLVRFEAREKGYDESILLNTQGYLACASVSNLFFIKGKTIFTPSIRCGILAGITRKVVFEICKKSGIRIKEGEFFPEDLKGANEIFLTNTLMGVMPVREVKGFFKGKKFIYAGLLMKELRKIG